MTERPKQYIGDGVYAEFTGHDIRIYTQRESGVHEIFVEPLALVTLIEFADKCWPAKWDETK